MSYSNLFGGDTAPSVTSETIESTARYQLLFVDDEPAILAALKRVFRHENYLISTANSGEEALKLVKDTTFNLVISDFKMPGMHGADLLREIKQQQPQSMRIMLTGQADTDVVMSAIKEGAVYRFILKPWNDDDLRLTVALALEQHELLKKNQVLKQQNKQQAHDLETMAKLTASNRSQLAILMHKKGLLNNQQLQQLHRDMQKSKQPVMLYLIEKGWQSEDKIRKFVQKELMFEEVDLKELQADNAVLALIPRSICLKNLILPLRVINKRLKLAMIDPMDNGLIEQLTFTCGMTIQPVLAAIADMRAKHKELFGDTSEISEIADAVSLTDPYEGIEIVIEETEESSLEELLLASDEAPAIRLVNAIILEALRLRASDIHIQPRTKSTVVRYRIDGVLSDKIQIPNAMHMSLISRIKVMAELDISERRKPQDGRITVKTPLRVVDLRISTLPTINGEKVVMRVLDRNSSVQYIEHLGFCPHDRERLLSVSTKPQGIILATGPTGSGKTTTLYAMLQHNASPQRNYVTIEDPVEFYLDMAGQVPVRERIGLNFATILRAILRQDPDVILLGEIRDHETAEVAFHAAMTGHVVYSTLHTNSAVGTVSRLLDLGLKPFVIASALECVIAQRLLRRVCSHCRREIARPDAKLKALGSLFHAINFPLYAGSGCERCNQGYIGRLGVYEVLTMNDVLREAITAGESSRTLLEQAQLAGMRTLFDDAYEKLREGSTTVDEIIRVLGVQNG